MLDKSDKYDSRDVERLQQDDKWVENYLIWRQDVVDDTLKMIDQSFQWRKEYTVNGKLLCNSCGGECCFPVELHLTSSLNFITFLALKGCENTTEY